MVQILSLEGKRMKKINFVGLLLVLCVGLSGCLFKKDGVEIKGKSKKKTTLSGNSGKGIPLSSGADQGKLWDDKVEAFALYSDEGDDAQRLSDSGLEVADTGWEKDDSLDARHFQPVTFAFDSWKIEAAQKPKVDINVALAREALSDEETAIVVAGNSDSQFVSEIYNIAVSENRARAMAKEFEQKGIDKKRIKTIGYGDSRKVVDVPGREEKNRRVDLEVLRRIN